MAEAERAKKVYNQYADRDEDIANKLGISSHGANRDKIKFELTKIKNKPKLMDRLGITSKDLKLYGL